MTDILADRFRLDAEIARGAAGTVYRAHDLITDEPVAVKVLHDEAAADASVTTAFLDEARVLSELDHPGIVRPRDLILNGSLMALVMDLVEGDDLRRRVIDDGPLSPKAAARLVGQIAEALAAVHEAGIVHGDVKPGNILVPDDGGGARLVDFGIARRIADPEGPTHGTPDYTAPEIVVGRPSSSKSDVYGLGLVLFESLCGRNPYRGGGIDDVLERHRALLPVRPEPVPVELWSLIESCLATRPESRPDAKALVSMLRAVGPVLSDEPSDPLPEPLAMRPRDEEPAPPRPAVATTMLPSVSIVTRGDESRTMGKGMLVGAAVAVLVLVLGIGAVLALSMGGNAPAAEPPAGEQATQDDSGDDSTDASPGPSSPDGPTPDPSDESTEDGVTDDGSGDDGQPSIDVPEVPGEDLVGSVMPGRSG